MSNASSVVNSDALASLEHLRHKLLDLSGRNRLLSFKHTRTNCIRAVDEVPNQLFEALVSGGKSFKYGAVPEPSVLDLRRYAEAEQGVPRAEIPEAELNRPRPEVWAQHLGIEIEHELPIDLHAERPRQHTDSCIQTALYADQLDTRLRKLLSDARTAIEETGTNILYLAFGFLEWHESRAGATPSLAPLLLVPVQLERERKKGGKHVYRISWNGEDIQPNLSLQKKLYDDFSLEIPEINSDVLPDAYFQTVRRLVSDRTDWRVRRYVTLSFFQFGKHLLYRDLDMKNWPQGAGPDKHPIVAKLLTGEGENGTGVSFEKRENLAVDEIDLALELIDRADSTQATAMIQALSGESMVIQGPPGTGKSQTITNLIAALLGAGKTVLFVSEKLAALEVVRRRLDEVGLGDFVLELHSHKTSKQALIEDLGHRLKAGARHRPPKEFADERDRLVDSRNRLQDYVRAIATPFGALGIQASELLFEAGRLRRRLGDRCDVIFPPASFDPMIVSKNDRKYAEEALLGLEALIRRLGGIEQVANHAWAGVSSAQVLGAPDEVEVLTKATAWKDAMCVLHDAATAAVTLIPTSSEQLTLDVTLVKDFETLSSNLVDIDAMREDLNAAQPLVSRVVNAFGIEPQGEVEAFRVVRDYLLVAEQASDRVHRAPRIVFTDEMLDRALHAFQIKYEGLVGQLEEIGQTLQIDELRRVGAENAKQTASILKDRGFLRWFKGEWRRTRKAARGLVSASRCPNSAALAASFAAGGDFLDSERAFLQSTTAEQIGVSTLDECEERIADALAAREWVRAIEAKFGGGFSETAVFGRAMIDAESSAVRSLRSVMSGDAGQAVLRVAERIDRAGEAIRNERVWEAFLRSIVSPKLASDISELDGKQLSLFLASLPEVARAASLEKVAAGDFASRVDLDRSRWFQRVGEELADRCSRMEAALARRESLSEWLEIDIALRRIQDPTVESIASLLVSGEVDCGSTVDLYNHWLFDGLCRKVFEAHPVLLERGAGEQDRLRSQYAARDGRLMELRAREIASRLARKSVPRGTSGARVRDLTENALISHEVSKQKRHVPVRQLVSRAGRALQALKPCFMMGPLSVAQYLPPGLLKFDLIVFDEASQVRPEEAIGAIARGQQAIVVGDSRQLPPTSFFEKTGDSEDPEEETVTGVAESILEVFEARFPSAMLQWHYRSQDPQLIAFSNERFYDGDLVLFPTPKERDDSYGVKFHYVEDGIFSGSVNEAEVEAVANAVAAHLRHSTTLSLGVVAMNVAQRDAIENRIDVLLQDDPLLLDAAENSATRQEPFFVKNLENVQGDERDVIMISMTYGPNEVGGRVAQRFGPINGDSGWRRLNVLFSRAKRRMEVFSSLREADIVPGSATKRGPRELKAFLRFAESGTLAGESASTGRDPDSEFEIAVLEGLAHAGFTCEPQVGCHGFRIDIAIVDPNEQNAYAVGIECDGASYHSSQSARDRDRLRQEILERLGWRIIRVWSTDWYRDPNRELSTIIAKVNGVIERRQLERVRRNERSTSSAIVDASHRDQAGSNHEETASAQGPDSMLSEADARRELIQLRDEISATDENIDVSRSLFRKAMLDELLRCKPTDLHDLRTNLNEELLRDTHEDEIERYGERVIGILKRIES